MANETLDGPSLKPLKSVVVCIANILECAFVKNGLVYVFQVRCKMFNLE